MLPWGPAFTCAAVGTDPLGGGRGRAGHAGPTGLAVLTVGSQDVLLDHTSSHDGFIPGHLDAGAIDAAGSGGSRHPLWGCERIKGKNKENGSSGKTIAPFFTFNGTVNQTRPLA